MTVPGGQDDRDAGPFIATAGMDSYETKTPLYRPGRKKAP
jgi:hypothetical protein